MNAVGAVRFAPRFPRPKPTSVLELEPAERLVVWALRAWIAGGWRQEAVWREFTRQFGSDASVVLSLFERLLRDLQCRARRPFRCGGVDDLALLPDEVCLLLAISALQAEEIALARSVIGWLAPPEAVGPLLESAAPLAVELEAADFICPLRVSTPRIKGMPPELIALQ